MFVKQFNANASINFLKTKRKQNTTICVSNFNCIAISCGLTCVGPTDWKAYVELSRLFNWHKIIADRSESGPGCSAIMSHARQIQRFQRGVSNDTSYRSNKWVTW